MSQIPTAEEFFKKYSSPYQFEEGSPEYLIDEEDFLKAMVKYAKLHVEAALKVASEQAEMKPYPYNGCPECGRDDMDIDKQSILNAYPSNLIV